MCIMLSEHEPETTKLIHVPVYLKFKNGDVKYNLCIYVNNIDTDGVPALMVVPFPKVNGKPIGMMNIDTDNMKNFRKAVFDLMPKLESRSLGVYTNGKSADGLTVHEIGNYNISIASDVNSLLNRVDWSRFSRPYDFEDRIATFKNKYLYPTNCVYVVAQARKNIKNDGFGIVYPDMGVDYFPTAHEDIGRSVKYDVECYHFTSLRSNYIPFGDSKLKIHEHSDQSDITKILKMMDDTVILDDGGKVRLRKTPVRRINMWKISGRNRNKNMYIKNELMWKNEEKT